MDSWRRLILPWKVCVGTLRCTRRMEFGKCQQLAVHRLPVSGTEQATLRTGSSMRLIPEQLRHRELTSAVVLGALLGGLLATVAAASQQTPQFRRIQPDSDSGGTGVPPPAPPAADQKPPP